VRRHSNAPIKQIAASITRFGFNNPILTAGDGEIVAGHGRLAAAKLLGLAIVPTLRLSHLSEAERALMGSQTTSWRSTPAGTAKCLRSNCRT
jgi:ParB-like chromosome segregation protein Spo0J